MEDVFNHVWMLHTNFLAYFIKAEHLSGKSAKGLKLDTNDDNKYMDMIDKYTDGASSQDNST